MQPADIKSVGIIGAGHIGQVMAQIALRAVRQVVIANSQGPESLASVVRELGEGVTAGIVKDAAAADIVVLAVMWPQVPQAVEGLEWEGRTVIDPTNDFDPSDLNGRTSSEVVADLVAPARVVKAGNTFAAGVLASDPHEAGGQRVIFVSGDEADAKAEAIALFQDAGFFTVDLGSLSRGGEVQQFHGPLAGLNLVRLP
jgi:predicted dinucleotide-binding enzyme